MYRNEKKRFWIERGLKPEAKMSDTTEFGIFALTVLALLIANTVMIVVS